MDYQITYRESLYQPVPAALFMAKMHSGIKEIF